MEIMFDIETLDVTPTATVLSIGAVSFDGVGRVWDSFMRVLEVQEQLDRGSTISFNTLQWWLSQDVNARDEAFTAVRHGVRSALTEFRMFCINTTPDAYWALGPQFDAIILGGLFDRFGIEVPWGYSALRDVRTMLSELDVNRDSASLADSKVVGVPHTPVFDCERQVELLTLARGKMCACP